MADDDERLCRTYSPRVCDLRHDAAQREMRLCIQRIEARLDASDQALLMRTTELERRLEGLNQLRSEVIRDRDMFLRAEVYNIKTTFYDAWVAEVNRKLTTMETRSVIWTSIVAAVFLMVQLAVHVWKP